MLHALRARVPGPYRPSSSVRPPASLDRYQRQSLLGGTLGLPLHRPPVPLDFCPKPTNPDQQWPITSGALGLPLCPLHHWAPARRSRSSMGPLVTRYPLERGRPYTLGRGPLSHFTPWFHSSATPSRDCPDPSSAPPFWGCSEPSPAPRTTIHRTGRASAQSFLQDITNDAGDGRELGLRKSPSAESCTVFSVDAIVMKDSTVERKRKRGLVCVAEDD